MKNEKTLSQHLSDASKARHAMRTPEERSAYAKMMVAAREAKRQARKAARDPDEKYIGDTGFKDTP